MRRLARFHPFLCLLLLTGIVMAIGYAFDPQYDDQSWGFVWFLAAMVVAAPYRIVAMPILAAFGDSTASDILIAVTYAAVLIAADITLTRWARSPIIEDLV